MVAMRFWCHTARHVTPQPDQWQRLLPVQHRRHCCASPPRLASLTTSQAHLKCTRSGMLGPPMAHGTAVWAGKSRMMCNMRRLTGKRIMHAHA